MSARALPKATVKAVGERAGDHCECCGRRLRGLYSHHHRRPRAMGGTRDPLAGHPSNIVLICGSGTTGCHGWIERNRFRAWENGWIIRQETAGEPTDPRVMPVWLPRRNSWMIPGPGRWFALPERISGHDLAGILRA